ncbi:potassium transporter Kup [Arsenicicoccus piscis]|uniref:potassium transporter Kup n=1 Tax=Arsenicicoccus piscis TaxID=673954 RepID=UPI001F4C5B5C|nr:potassium transporter Kup [Arsenicicoccus piscis]MCH8626549.1 potassium transporter Kup [Arsenicicoccus piscis]
MSQKPLGPLTLGALGVVFGDIGTSPLYSLQTVFSIEHNTVEPTHQDVYGVISLVFWSITVVVSIKYVAFILRADNDGEGGILALAALLRSKLGSDRHTTAVVLLLGIVGAALFYGDSVITPAISVMSAVEGLEVANPGFASWVLPCSVGILAVLFVVQRFGTEVVGRAFGPVMVCWFVLLAVLGVPHIAQHPEILRSVSPTYAILFGIDRPWVAFVAMGAVVLTITGAEALYADMGHFGARPIRLAWFGLVFPSLLLNYLGQGAMMLHDPSTVANPFFSLAPSWATVPLVVLATLATVIASQAVISGAFSVSRQAVRLGLLPRLTVNHTSREEGGQIYVPAINWLLFGGVLLLVGVFQASARLATAYGLAVTGTLLLTTGLFLLLAHHVWGWATWKLALFAVVIGGAELTFFAANLTKLVTGGWLPLLIAAGVVVVMTTWRTGAKLVTERRVELEGPLTGFIEEVNEHKVRRVPGLAVYPHPTLETTPLALRANTDFNQVLHEHVVILRIVNEDVPHIRHVDRISVDDLGHEDDGIFAVSVRLGFNDDQDIPKALRLAAPQLVESEMKVDVAQARYFLSAITVHRGVRPELPRWRQALFVAMAHNAANRVRVFHLPPDRTVAMGAHVDL